MSEMSESRNMPAGQQPVPAVGMNSTHSHRNVPSPQAMSIVERYDGQADAHAWLDSLLTLADLHGWEDAACLSVAKVRMTGPALRWTTLRTFRDWDDFQEQFIRRFGETRETAVARLSRCFQKDNESPKAFADRFLEDAEKAGRAQDEALVYQFLQQMRPDLNPKA